MSAYASFSTLPWRERLFVRARGLTAPLASMADLVEGHRVADVGCGHGLLSALVLERKPFASVVGIDVDERKVRLARASVGRRPNAHFEVMTVERLAEQQPGGFTTVLVADVLYLLPVERWPSFLGACHRLLAPGGMLLLKEAEADGSWKEKKALLQEQVMVRLVGKTRSSGALSFSPRETFVRTLAHCRLHCEAVHQLGRWSSTPHVLFIARPR